MITDCLGSQTALLAPETSVLIADAEGSFFFFSCMPQGSEGIGGVHTMVP